MGEHRCDFATFLKPRQVIPMHDEDREGCAAIRARDSGFQRIHPLTISVEPGSTPFTSRSAAPSRVVRTVVRVAAVPAVDEFTVHRAVEFGFCLPLMATPAAMYALRRVVGLWDVVGIQFVSHVLRRGLVQHVLFL